MDLDFNALGNQANEMMNAEPTTVDTPAASTPEPTTGEPSTPSISDPSTQTLAPDTGATPPAVSSPADEKLQLELGNGKVETLTRQEIAQRLIDAQKSEFRQADYTRKSQENARIAQELQTQQHLATQRLQQAEYLLNNPHLLQAEAQRRALINQPIDPNQPMTVGQGMQLVQAMQQEVQSLQQQAVNEAAAARQAASSIVEDRLQVANMSESIGKTLSAKFTQHPVLKTIPEMETIIRYRVAQMEPENIEEAVKAFGNVADELAKTFGGVYTQQQQAQVVAKAKLVSQGIEPPGGVAPQPAKQDYKTKEGRDLDWTKLKDAALSQYGQ